MSAIAPSKQQLLEPAVAAIEAAIYQIECSGEVTGASREEALAALERARRLLVQQWFGAGSGQAVLF